MKIPVIGDPHAKPSNLEMICELAGQVEDLGDDVVIWLGDMLDTKEVVRSRCLNFWYDYFKSSKKSHIVLVGNHDWHNLECQAHSLEPLKELQNVAIVDEPYIEEFQGDVKALFMPYYHDPENFLKDVKENLEGSQYVFIHQGVNGFDFGNGHVEVNGVDFKSLPDNVEKVISGHFHKEQEEGRLLYPGTPFSHNFGESNQEKAIRVFNTETGEFERLPTIFPRHLTLEFDAKEFNSLEEFPANPEKDYVRVVLTGAQEEIDAVEKSKYPKVKFIERPDEEFSKSNPLTETQSNEEKFILWGKDIKGLDEKTIQKGVEIMREVT